MRLATTAGLAAALLCLASTARAQDEVPFITTDELKKAMAAPAKTWKHVLIDARAKVEFGEGHIKGAVNLPAADTESKLGELAKDKSLMLVFYCNGPRCTKSVKGAKIARGMGYANVKVYNEGLPAWAKGKLPLEGKPFAPFEAETISAQALQDILRDSGGALVIDIRDAVEYQGFHIAQTKSIPLDEIPDRLAELPADKVIVMVDHIGHQTPLASRLLNGHGRSKLKRLDGGIMAWRSQGLPVVSKK